MTDILDDLRSLKDLGAKCEEVAERAIAEIERLRRNLNGRDEYLGKIGQWQAFVDQLPR